MNARVMISSVFVLILAILYVVPVQALPCDEAQELRRERISFDVEMRRKRIALRESIIDLKKNYNELDGKMADIEEQILKSDSNTANALWMQYDATDKQKEELLSQIDELQKKDSQVTSERTVGKIDRKYKQTEKYFECVFNAPLGKKLADIEQRLIQEKKQDEPLVKSLLSLVKQRTEAVNALKSSYDQHKKTVDLKLKELRDIRSQISDTERSKKYEGLSEEIELWANELNDLGDKSNDISKRILPYLDRLK